MLFQISNRMGIRMVSEMLVERENNINAMTVYQGKAKEPLIYYFREFFQP